MTQEERWRTRYDEVRNFIEKNRRNPSRHRVEEHLMLNWAKQQRKLMNKGELKPDRLAAFKLLIALCEQYKRKNQYV